MALLSMEGFLARMLELNCLRNNCIYPPCSVSKRILPSNSEDLNLNDNLWVIYARRTTDNTLANGIMTHSGAGNGARGVSSARFSPASSTSGAMRESMFGIVTMLLTVIVMVTSL